MSEERPSILHRALKSMIRRLLELSTLRFAVLFLVVAVAVSVMIVLTIDFLWDGHFNKELEFAGVVTPFLDGLFLVIFVAAMLDEIREEVRQRKRAEAEIHKLNADLEEKIKERTQQLVAAQEELVRNEKLALLGQVADTVGHELRNPLGVMNNAVYFLQAVLPDADETTKEYLGIIREEIVEAERIVSDLLDAVRTKLPQPEAVAVAGLIGKVLHKCDAPASVAVRLDIPETIGAVSVDPAQMHQVLWNLLTNGIEAMPDGGTLDITAGADPLAKTVTISVRDSGSGIAPENLAKLFQPMFTTKARRVGLGLVVVKNLTQANGGSVSAESEPGQGSTFSITLPCAGNL